ncbi:MAG: OmpA family protein [Gammaproteobacteria bacterium]|nr:OmpA family protein [Gammaproteobacteria bacterium]MBU1481148.1 OmpA family protein [Gammaproteobacteria bacterium]
MGIAALNPSYTSNTPQLAAGCFVGLSRFKTLAVTLLACLIAAPAWAEDKQCDGNGFCTPLAQPGNSLMQSRVLMRPQGDTPPSAEYRLPEATQEAAPPVETQLVEKITTEINSTADETRPIFYTSGKNFLNEDFKKQLLDLAQYLRGKRNLRMKIVGHADEQRLSARAKAIYGDNIGLSNARAMEAANFLHAQPDFADVPISTEGKGDTEPRVHCQRTGSVVEWQACLAPNRRVDMLLWYDTVKENVTQVPSKVVTPVHSVATCGQFRAGDAGLPFRISVDGEPLLDNDLANTADVTRCTDVALDQADIQLRFDALEEKPWLNLTAFPDAAVRQQPVHFTSYSNYRHWIARGEVRLFGAGKSTQSEPLQVLPLDANGQVYWIPDEKAGESVVYVLRVYDRDGNFDETLPQALPVVLQTEALERQSAQREELIGYGENHLALHNIPVHGGAVTANGDKLLPGQKVRFMGQEIPVDANGKFAARQILPPGSYAVDVDVLEADDKVALHFERNIYIPDNDWFYIALGDLTAGQNATSGPAQLVTADTQHYDSKAYVDGRLAFYLKGKVKGDWLLTAAADTQEQPLKNLFSNFSSKDPRYLLRRLDPDRYYPVYGDDSTTVDDAPTSGKFYVKLAKGDSHVMWGNFQTQIAGSDLVQYSRGMYGANVKWRSEDATGFGQKKTQADLFAGDPGTLGAREQFRGTGGSLYYVQHMDVTSGSEHLWVEVRDRDSGLVLKVTQLSAAQDYDFDPIQGRILLQSPLPSTADDSQLVRAGSLSGNPVYLVATYEYVPGVTQADNMTVGGRVSQWLGDSVQVGVTGYRQGDTATRQKLGGVDATYRMTPGTYVKAEAARSDGAGTSTQSSATGGFEFNPITSPGGKANANRVEAAVDLAEVSSGKGKLNGYWQQREKGFSSPGLVATEDIRQKGFAADVEIAKDTTLQTKADTRDAASQSSKALSAALRHQFTANWAASVGTRFDDLDTPVANASPTLSQNGARTDLGAQIEYAPDSEGAQPEWKAYGFAQDSLKHSGNRAANNRIGAGGSKRLNEKFNMTGEVSGGSGGVGGKVGGEWQVSDRSQLYMNYASDTDRTDSLYRGRQSTLVSGAKTRYTDSLSIYGEERLLNGVGQSGLMHAFGLDLAAQDGWNFGFKGEVGDLADASAGDFSRKALTFSVGRVIEKTKYAGNVEWRNEDGTLIGHRTTWLVRNALGYQVDADWRFLGKLNFSVSNSSLGSAYDADYTELVTGYAWRPVENDKLNALFKYTYFANRPSSATVSTAGVTADYEQRSHILSTDATYDVRPWLSIGGKYGYRRSEMRTPAAAGDWQNADANLVIARADWHFVHEWDALAELRRLSVPAANDRRSGALLAIYRHIDRNVKIGAGYNFADFSDDLTDMSYRSRGWFINLIGEF